MSTTTAQEHDDTLFAHWAREMLERLRLRGTLVYSRNLDPREVDLAQLQGRYFEDKDGFGFVYRAGTARQVIQAIEDFCNDEAGDHPDEWTRRAQADTSLQTGKCECEPEADWECCLCARKAAGLPV